MHAFLHVVSGDGPHLIPLASVVEVLPMVTLDRGLELGDPRYCGLLQYRGDVLPTFALSDEDTAPQEHPGWMLVVVRSQEGASSWVVRDVAGVLDVAPERIARPQVGGASGLAVVDVDGVLVRVLGSPEG